MQFVVIGLGTFGEKVISTLMQNGAQVIAIDKNKIKIEMIKDKVTMALILDSTDEEAMRASEIEEVDAAVVALGDSQEEAILTTAILKRMGIYPIYARAVNPLYAHVLKLVGADQAIIIEERMGEEVAKRLLAPEIHDKVFLSSGHTLVELEAKNEFIGKTLKDLDIRNNYGVNVIAIHRKVHKVDEEGKIQVSVEVNDLPGSEDMIQKGDILVVVGKENDIERLALSKRKNK